MNKESNQFRLEQMALGEISVDPNDERVRAQLAEIHRSNEEILRELPPSSVAREVARRRSQQRPSRQWLWRVVPAVAMAVVAGAYFVPSPRAVDDYVGTKGLTPHLLIYRQDGAHAEVLREGSLAHRGDVLQLSYVSVGKRWGAIFSVDSRRNVTLHLPLRTEDGAATLRGPGEVRLDAAYALDDAPGFERFYFVVAEERFELAPWLAKARQDPATVAKGTLPIGTSVYEMVVGKVSR